MTWANSQYTRRDGIGYDGADNGILQVWKEVLFMHKFEFQILILEAVMPHAKTEIKACRGIYSKAQNYNLQCVIFILILP